MVSLPNKPFTSQWQLDQMLEAAYNLSRQLTEARKQVVGRMPGLTVSMDRCMSLPSNEKWEVSADDGKVYGIWRGRSEDLKKFLEKLDPLKNSVDARNTSDDGSVLLTLDPVASSLFVMRLAKIAKPIAESPRTQLSHDEFRESFFRDLVGNNKGGTPGIFGGRGQ